MIDKLIADAQPVPTDNFELKGNDEQLAIESYSGRVTTLDDALAKSQVDLDVYAVDSYVIKHYEMGSKGPDNKPVVTPMTSIRVNLKKKKGWSYEEFRSVLSASINAIPARSGSNAQKRKTGSEERLLAVLSIFDAHFGKLSWKPESGANYDIDICRDRYMDAATDLIGRARDRKSSRLLYVLGQDFFHVDRGNMTTNGTPVDCDGRWQKAFLVGTECAIKTIQLAKKHFDVDVMVVPGNHDREKAFCLGELVRARFYSDRSVRVINEPSVFSYYRFGANLLGFVHGDQCNSDKKRGELPQTMATDRPADWAETISRSWYLGHFHSEKEEIWKHRTADSIRDVTVRVIPSISSTDSWHRQQNYKSVLAAELHYHHFTKGRYGYEVYQIPE